MVKYENKEQHTIMNSFFVAALKSFCCNHKFFGDSVIFVRFERDPLEKFSGLNSKIIFGRVVYRSHPDKEEQTSPPLMLKLMPSVTMLSEDVALVQFFNEILFHTRALPVLQKLGDFQLLAKFFDSHTHLSASTNDFLLIFEDLRSLGYRNYQKHLFLDLEHLSLMLRKLGQFHAYSYRAKEMASQKFEALNKWFYDTHNTLAQQLPKYVPELAERGLQRLQQDRRYQGRLALLEKIVENGEKFLRRINTSEKGKFMSVLCHGDYLRGNVMFRYDENDHPVDLKMVDLAACRIGSPIIDLSTVLYLNASQKMRNLHWDDLIDAYYEGLSEAFDGDVPSRESILCEFQTKVLYAYFVASYFLPDSIATDRGEPNFVQLFPPEYASCTMDEIPQKVRVAVGKTVGGEEGTEAVADVLRDMIDRGFI